MRRRTFIASLGAASLMAPIAARAQQSDKLPRIAVLPAGYLQTDPEGQARIQAFLDGLAKRGWSDGRNVRVDIQWSSNEIDRIRMGASALVSSAPDVIVISSNAALAVRQKLSSPVPTVFVQVSDPVGSGFVNSLARPDGPITGFQNFEPATCGKWLGLLKEVAPTIVRVAVLVHPDTAAHFEFLRAAETVAPSLGVQLHAVSVRNGDEITRGVTDFAATRDGGLIVLPHPVNIDNRVLLIELTARLGLPAIYPFRYFATSGGLMSYGFDQVEQWRGAADYVDRLLRGAKPAELPVQAPTNYETVINARTAKTLGLAIPPSVLARADEVIE